MSVINTNYLSLVAQNNLQKSQSALGSAIERLSSGLRINSAKDDAAGQAIANRMTSQVNGLNQAQRNANDGISIAQTAEGGLNQINENLQRIRELTVQAQNGTNSASDIDSIQQEVNQRLEEINRIATETDFNGTKILETSSGAKTISIQVGAKDAQKIDIKIDANAAWNKFQTTGSTGAVVPGSSETRAVLTKGFDVLAAGTTTVAVNVNADVKSGISGAVGALSFKEGAAGELYIIDAGRPTNSQAFAVTQEMISSGGIVSVDISKLTAVDEATVTGSAVTGGNALTDVGGGNAALAQLDNALKAVDNQRSQLGAIQNRFESAITNLQTNSTNLQAARSRIEDADYAVEVANMSKNQILQQAGTSVLAQANQIPQGVLSLLR